MSRKQNPENKINDMFFYFKSYDETTDILPGEFLFDNEESIQTAEDLTSSGKDTSNSHAVDSNSSPVTPDSNLEDTSEDENGISVASNSIRTTAKTKPKDTGEDKSQKSIKTNNNETEKPKPKKKNDLKRKPQDPDGEFDGDDIKKI